jgi:hypothetical protein
MKHRSKIWVIAILAAAPLLAGGTGAQASGSGLASPDTDARGIPLSAIDQTTGTGCPETLPPSADHNALGIPLSALDATLGLDGQGLARWRETHR